MSAVRCAALVAALACAAGAMHAQQEQQPPADATGVLIGQVVDAITGEPVRGAQVMVQCAGQGVMYRQLVSDRTGNFLATRLSAGTCNIAASHRDYAGIMGLGQLSVTADLAAGQEKSGVVVKLMPGGSIAGHVVNDDGEPEPYCVVTALAPVRLGDLSSLQQRSGVQTDDQGVYRLTGLTADRYLVHVSCQESLPVERQLAPGDRHDEEPAESWLPMFFPNSPNAAGATLISVLPGAEAQNVDFKLRPRRVSTVRGTIAGAPGPAVNVQLLPDAASGDPHEPIGGYYQQKDGTFRIDYVPPGSYWLVAMSQGTQQDVAWVEARISVGSQRPAPVVLQMQPAPSVRGVVEDPPDAARSAGLAGNPPPSGIRSRTLLHLGPGQQSQTPQEPPKGWVQFVPMGQVFYGGERQAEVKQDGTFEVQGLMPGRYMVNYMPAGIQAHVESMQYGATKLDNNQIEIGAALQATLRITLSSRGGHVDVLLPQDAPDEKSNWNVYLMPAARGAQMPSGIPILSGSGSTTLGYDNLPPGRYVAFALQQSGPYAGAAYNDRLFDLLQARLDSIEVSAGGTLTITPRRFTNDEISRIALAFLQGQN